MMKLYATILGTTLLGLYSVTSFAITGNQSPQPLMLNEGVSDTQLISSTPRRYELQMNQESDLKISSGHLASDSGDNITIQGRLYDEAGHLVSMDSSYQGHFMITERVTPGTYILEVKGDAMGSPNEVSNRYNLHLGVN
ncbi:hypothetical protein [Halomonas elongata]|uniref:hypothetical protein n=2 Tax=Halomonas elongata TaxID=2746 RepID=UPI00186B930A|nr:hypothetical protein [Halomonas elongata]MBW5801535.1 hypothetical protein [Halomonas elongata]